MGNFCYLAWEDEKGGRQQQGGQISMMMTLVSYDSFFPWPDSLMNTSKPFLLIRSHFLSESAFWKGKRGKRPADARNGHACWLQTNMPVSFFIFFSYELPEWEANCCSSPFTNNSSLLCHRLGWLRHWDWSVRAPTHRHGSRYFQFSLASSWPLKILGNAGLIEMPIAVALSNPNYIGEWGMRSQDEGERSRVAGREREQNAPWHGWASPGSNALRLVPDMLVFSRISGSLEYSPVRVLDEFYAEGKSAAE